MRRRGNVEFNATSNRIPLMRRQMFAHLGFGFFGEASAAEARHDSGGFARLRIFFDLLGEDDSAGVAPDAKFLQRFPVHPDSVIVVGDEKRRTAAS